MLPLRPLAAAIALAAARSLAAAQIDSLPALVIRASWVGYLPDAPKVAVACALDTAAAPAVTHFVVLDQRGRTVLGPRRAEPAGAFGPCARTYRMDFSALRRPGHALA